MNLLLEAGANDVLVVGGFVRDHLLGIESKDVDIEVFGLSLPEVATVLSRNSFKTDLVGQSFGVVKVDNEIDVSIPREDSKSGDGHRGFDVNFRTDMTFAEAGRRRDFTINTMGMRLDGELVDPHGGEIDLAVRYLRAVDYKTFADDPLRVMRAMQFAARFEANLEPMTEVLCRSIAHRKSELPKERIWEEWKKWALKGVKPSAGLFDLTHVLWDNPEIRSLHRVPQDPEWHPEGNVFIHTCQVVDCAAHIAEREQLDDDDRLVLMFSALCHDFGKASTTKFVDGRWRATGHCAASVPLAEKFLRDIGAPKFVISQVKELVAEHLIHAGANPTDRAIKRLSNRLKHSSIRMLDMVVEADASGRKPLPWRRPMAHWVEAADKLGIANRQPEHILKGRHLLDLGMQPNKRMGVFLKVAFNAQLDGQFDNIDEAIKWAQKLLDDGWQ